MSLNVHHQPVGSHSPEYCREAVDAHELDEQQISQTGSRLAALTALLLGAFLQRAEEQELCRRLSDRRQRHLQGDAVKGTKLTKYDCIF